MKNGVRARHRPGRAGVRRKGRDDRGRADRREAWEDTGGRRTGKGHGSRRGSAACPPALPCGEEEEDGAKSRQFAALGHILGSVSVGCLIINGAARAEETLRDFAQPDLRDFSAAGVIVQKNDAALNKIGRNFAQGYRVRELPIWYKEPSKLRVDAKAGFLSIRYVINGNRKATQVPALHISKVKGHHRPPGRGAGDAGLGIITPLVPRQRGGLPLCRSPGAGRASVPVFEFWYTADKISRHHMLWIDPEKRIILRHDVDDRHGHPWVRYVLKQPIQMAGIWVPTRLEVYSADGHLAAVTRYTNVKVNSGLSESLFHV